MKDSDLKTIQKLARTGSAKTDLARRTVTANGIYFSSEDRAFSRNVPQTWNVEIDTSSVTDQKGAGLCWLYAALNHLRHRVEREQKIATLEFSETYLFFFDKLECANAFLEMVWGSRDKSLSARENDFLEYPSDDGGRFSVAANLIDKYGLVPVSVMPESENTAYSRNLNTVLGRTLRRAAVKLRELPSRKAFDAAKSAALADVYRVLSISLGEPPKKFAWSYRDTEKKNIHKFSGTPRDFAKSLGLDKISEKYVDLRDTPTLDYGKVYGEKRSWSMAGKHVTALNLPLAEQLPLILKQLREKEGVPAAIASRRDITAKNQGVMDPSVYDLENLFGVKFDISRKDRLRSHEDLADHAVLIVGADAPHGRARWYKIENSWGVKVGDGGFWAMSAAWAAEYLSGVTIRRDLLPPDIAGLLDQPPILLDYWEEYGD